MTSQSGKASVRRVRMTCISDGAARTIAARRSRNSVSCSPIPATIPQSGDLAYSPLSSGLPPSIALHDGSELGALGMESIAFMVNGKPASVAADPDTPLLDILRNHLGLVGTKFGCGIEQCG